MGGHVVITTPRLEPESLGWRTTRAYHQKISPPDGRRFLVALYGVRSICRWIVRCSSILVVLLLLIFVIGDRPGRAGFRLHEMVGFLFFPVGVVVGFIVAWRREGTGALISLTSLAMFYIYMVVLMGRFPGGPWFLVFTLPAFFFGASALLPADTIAHPKRTHS